MEVLLIPDITRDPEPLTCWFVAHGKSEEADLKGQMSEVANAEPVGFAICLLTFAFCDAAGCSNCHPPRPQCLAESGLWSDGVLKKGFETTGLECLFVGAFEYDLARVAGLESLLPTRCAHAPLVAWL